MGRPDDEATDEDAFARAASRRQAGFFREFGLFLRDNRKWWLVPLVVALVAFGALILLGGTAVAPFIYTLF